MAPVQQSGSITPGHLAAWVTDGVVADGGVPAAAQKVLTRFGSADFNDTGDQPLILPSRMTAFMLTGIIVANASASLTLASGGFYPAASKAGTPLVGSTQVYSSLTTSAKLLSCTLGAAVASTLYTRGNIPTWAIYLSLTVPQGGAVTADVYIIGVDLS